jgi:hypothetical protein
MGHQSHLGALSEEIAREKSCFIDIGSGFQKVITAAKNKKGGEQF